MDRLPFVAPNFLLLVALLGCDEGIFSSAPAPAPEGRVVAVAAQEDEASASEFCDVLKSAANAPVFKYPPLDDGPPRASGWRWINVWASWCAPCVEEMPLMTRLHKELTASGAKVSLTLLSIDQTVEAMRKFQAAHPEAADSLRLRDYKALQGWLTSVGLDEGAPLPIHLFVDPRGKVRCARTGAVRDTDLPFLKKIIR